MYKILCSSADVFKYSILRNNGTWLFHAHEPGIMIHATTSPEVHEKMIRLCQFERAYYIQILPSECYNDDNLREDWDSQEDIIMM